jgi:glucose-1-phosphate adenylyltransferase
VIDRGCTIPEGTVIGENAQADAERFYRTGNGIVLVTSEALEKIASRANL